VDDLGLLEGKNAQENAPFATTHWSVIAAARQGEQAEARAALEKLCSTYWYPLYGFIRRRGHDFHRAQDLTQEFLIWFLESEHLLLAEPDRGKFRSFLLARLKHFLSDDWKRTNAQKRGGGQRIVSIDAELIESRLHLSESNYLSPDHYFDQQWGFTVLDQALGRLQKRCDQRGQRELFEILRATLGGRTSTETYSASAARLKITEGAIKVAIHRLRKELGELLRNEVAPTVLDPVEIDAEIRYLLEVTSL
jgi:RNA polymerase sigma factor (sigma-70 family)